MSSGCPRHLLITFVATALVIVATRDASARQKLYVVNTGDDDVTVVDVATQAVLGRVTVGTHPQGLAASASQDVIYVTVGEGKSGELLWVDPVADTVTRRMPVGPSPNQLAVTPDGTRGYVPCKDGYWDVVDLVRAKVITRIFTGGRPHNTLVSSDGAHIYLAPMGAPKKVTIIDVASNASVGEIAFGGVIRPIALSRDEKRLYAEVDDLVGVEVADVGTRTMVQRLPATLSREETGPSRSHGLGVRPDQRELWECDVEHRDLHVYDITDERAKQIATVPLGMRPYWLTFTPDGKTCFVAGGAEKGEVVFVDVAAKKAVGRVPVGRNPERLIVVEPPPR
jgi:YVTN family beta-propeller protein